MYLRILAYLVGLALLTSACVPATVLSPRVLQMGLARAADPTPPITLVPGTVSVDPDVSVGVVSALNQARSGLPTMQYGAITAISAAPGWQLTSVAGLRDLASDGSWTLAENASWFGLVLAHQAVDGGWIAAVERTPEFAALVAAAPETLLSTRAKADLVPTRGPGGPSSQALRFPWQPGTAMLFGTRGVHASDFDVFFGISGWQAVDMLSDGDTGQGHAPNHLLTAGQGTLGAVCNDGTSVAVRMDAAGSPQMLYVHLLNNSRLHSGEVFEQGEVLGQLKTGTFSAGCGWAQQGPGWFHVHWAFPGQSGSFQADGWTLTFIDATWRNGGQAVAVGEWLAAGPPAAPALSSPPEDAVLPASAGVKFTWQPAAGAAEYQLVWWGGPYTNTLPLGWFAGTSYDVGPVVGGTYIWRVRARNAAGLSPWSEARQITVVPLQITEAITVTPALQQTLALVTAQFAIQNTTTQTLTLRAVTARALPPDCLAPSCPEMRDFPLQTGVVLAPGQSLTYQGVRTFDVAGAYLAIPAYQDTDNTWRYAIPGANEAPFRITQPVSPTNPGRNYVPLLPRSSDFMPK